jgi:flagellar hook-associated protein 1 FlgK
LPSHSPAPRGNGNALALAQLANATGLNGYTFDQFYGNLGGRVGNDVSSATNTQTTKQNLLSQSQALRQQVSGVSLDTEAERLIAFQKSYEATSKMFTVLNQLTETLMNVIT